MSQKVRWNQVSRERKAKIAQAINSFGDNAHPVAQATNLDYFDMIYLLQCVMTGIEHDAAHITQKRIGS